MGRSKRGPALFELLDERTLTTGWRGPEALPAEVVEESEPERSQRPDADGVSGEPEYPDEKYETTEKSRPVWVEGDRLNVSLTSLSAAATAFVVMVLMAVGVGLGFRLGMKRGLVDGFESGRTSYMAETTSDIEAARAQVPATYLVGGLLSSPESGVGRAAPAGRPAEAAIDSQAGENRRGPAWIEGYTYVVTQEFMSRNSGDVEPARRYLSEHGIECAPVLLSGGQVQLTTRQGFDRTDPAQRKLADQLLEKVRAVGAQYFASGGRYRLEGYFKTYTNDEG